MFHLGRLSKSIQNQSKSELEFRTERIARLQHMLNGQFGQVGIIFLRKTVEYLRGQLSHLFIIIDWYRSLCERKTEDKRAGVRSHRLDAQASRRFFEW